MRSALNDTDDMIRMIETGVRSAIPWTKNFDLQPELQYMHSSLQRFRTVHSKQRNIRSENKYKAKQREKMLQGSIQKSIQRRNKLISLKKQQISFHTKKVESKLTTYQNQMKNQYKKGSTNQKKFADTLNQYRKNKISASQKIERNLYKRYQTQYQTSKSPEQSNFLLTQIKDDTKPFIRQIRRNKQQDSQTVNLVKKRMVQKDQQVGQHKFQKLMKKLSKIQCKKQSFYAKNLDSQNQRSVRSISRTSPNRKYITTKILQNIPQKPLLLYERKKISSKFDQNTKARKIIQNKMYQTHTKYLLKQKQRTNRINNMKQLKQKIIDTKLYVQRLNRRSNSLF